MNVHLLMGKQFLVRSCISRYHRIAMRKKAARQSTFANSKPLDALTGPLPADNRRALCSACWPAAIARAKRTQNIFSDWLYIDLDGFKAINDTHGHRLKPAIPYFADVS